MQRAWGEFRARRADDVAKIVDDEYLQLESPDECEASGSSPYLQFCGYDGDAVRCEASINTFLAKLFHLTPADIEALVESGWQAPADEKNHGSPNFYVEPRA